MSAVEALAASDITPDAIPDMDAELSAVFDRMETNNGADRAPNGKFTSPNPQDELDAEVPVEVEGETESVLEGAETAGEATEPEGSTASPSVPLPANWQGKETVWSKIPDEAKAEVAAIQTELQSRLSDQGRKIAEAKPITDVVNEYRHLFEGKIAPNEGIRLLAQAQANLENPQTRLQTLMSLIQGYGANEQIAAVLTGKSTLPQVPQPQPRQPDIEQVVTAKVAETLDLQKRETALNGFAEANPMWRQVNEDQQYAYTLAARTILPTASYDAVLKKALALAIDDNPALKAQVTAAAKPAVPPKQVSPEAAKRANSINVTSTSSGKVKEPSEDELLEQIWAKNQRG